MTVEYGTKIEDHRLDWQQNNQKELRADTYSVMLEASTLKGDDPTRLGRVILASSHRGSKRHLQQLHQDSMAVCRELGKPHLFNTATCNPDWPEIKDVCQKFELSGAIDCPTVVDRVFRMKFNEYIEDVIKRQMFGKVLGHMWVIEFQKRGLPHAHMLLILDEMDAP